MKITILQSLIILFCQTLIFAQVRDIWQTPIVVVKAIPTGNDIAFTVRVVKNDMAAANQRFSVRFQYDIARDTGFSAIVQRGTFDITTTCTVSSLDLALSKDFVVSGLQPLTTYFVRGRTTILYVDVFHLSDFSNTTSATTLAPSVPSPPILNPTMLVSSSSITFSWLKALGNPTLYLLDVATDKDFKSLLMNYNALRTSDTTVRVENLLPNTRYFARLRAENQIGNSPYSQSIEEKTLEHQKFSVTNHISASSFPKSVFPPIFGLGSEYYVYTQNKNITVSQADSVMLSLSQQLSIRNAWFQNNSLCTGNTKRSEFLVRLNQPDSKIERWGFQQTRTGTNFISPLWADTCECQQSYSYNLFLLPTSISSPRTIISLNISPNPTSDIASLHYTFPSPAQIQVEILDMLGRTTLPSIIEERSAGEQNIPLSLEGLSSGVYSVRLTVRTATGVRMETVRLVVVK
jgi:Secretion system C-terminal sorting domain/Fibronectin type III domain